MDSPCAQIFPEHCLGVDVRWTLLVLGLLGTGPGPAMALGLHDVAISGIYAALILGCA